MSQENAAPTTDILDDLIFGVYKAALVKGAIELEVFGKVAAGQTTAEAMARTNGWDSRSTRLMLDGLCSLKLLAKMGGTYRLTPVSETFLVPGRLGYVGAYTLHDMAWEARGRYAQSVQTGIPAMGDMAAPNQSSLWEIFAHVGLNRDSLSRSVDSARELWETIGVNRRTVLGARVLDLACGKGIKTLTLAKLDPEATVTGIDWENVLRTTAQVAQILGVSDRLTLVPGDILTADFGQSEYDVVFMGNITHYFRPEQNVSLFSRAHAALRPGGRLVINAPMVDEERCTSEYLLYSAMFVVESPAGDTYTFSEYRRMLEASGFERIYRYEHPWGLLSARK